MKTSLALTPARLSKVPFLFAGDLMTGIAAAAELGYDAVELHLRDPDAEDMDAIFSAVAVSGLGVSSLGTGQACTLDGLTFTSPDESIRERCCERITHHIEWAADVNAVVILGSVQGRFESEPAVRDRQWEGACRVLRTLADFAAARRVTLALEPLNRYETNVANTAERMLELIAEVGRPNVKILLDTFHMNIEEASMVQAIERVGSRLALVHLSDSNRRAPGMGHTDFKPVVSALRRAGYSGYLSAEIFPWEDDRSAADTFARNVKRLLLD
jgi:sugar phosphate isomerase/epimerase